MTYTAAVLGAITEYAKALGDASRKVGDVPNLGITFAPVVWEGEVIGFLNRELDDHDFDFVPIRSYESSQLWHRLFPEAPGIGS